jgi:YfiH family protein
VNRFTELEITPTPERFGAAVGWAGTLGGARLLCLGRGAPARGAVWPEGLTPQGVDRGWLVQVHSARALEAHPGACGEGDALIVRRPALAAIVASADCVPVLLVGDAGAAAVHAGWRGLAAGVIPAAIERLGGIDAAWIGPAIGPCCYEVSEEVAAAVTAASAAAVRRPGAGTRPHLDLARAASVQLERAGAGTVTILRHCTRCRAEWLESHRRDGERAGRNLALIWFDGP